MDEYASAAFAIDLREQCPCISAVNAFVNANARIRWFPARSVLTGRGVDNGQIGAGSGDSADSHRQFLLHQRKPCSTAVLRSPDTTIGRAGQNAVALHR